MKEVSIGFGREMLPRLEKRGLRSSRVGGIGWSEYPDTRCQDGGSMPKQIITSSSAPTTGFTPGKAVSPLAQAIRFGNMLFVWGQGSLDPVTGAVIEGDIVVQTRQTLDNLMTDPRRRRRDREKPRQHARHSAGHGGFSPLQRNLPRLF